MDINRIKNNKGSSVVEVLVSISILAVIGLGVSMTVITSASTHKHITVNTVASQLAISKAEELAAINAQALTHATHSNTESSISVTGLDNVTFTREVTVTEGTDSVLVEVDVTSNHGSFPNTVNHTVTYPYW